MCCEARRQVKLPGPGNCQTGAPFELLSRAKEADAKLNTAPQRRQQGEEIVTQTCQHSPASSAAMHSRRWGTPPLRRRTFLDRAAPKQRKGDDDAAVKSAHLVHAPTSRAPHKQTSSRCKARAAASSCGLLTREALLQTACSQKHHTSCSCLVVAGHAGCAAVRAQGNPQGPRPLAAAA